MPTDPPRDRTDALGRELIALRDHDLGVRAELAADGSLFDGYHPRMEAVHRANAARLRAIIDAHGWPGRSLVGDEAAGAAFMMVQHSIGEPDFMRRGLELMRAAAARGDLDPALVAMLEDRVRDFEGRGQLYGTQFHWDGAGEMSPRPIEDPDGLDARRAAMGLPPLAEAIVAMRVRAAASNERPPADPAGHDRGFTDWLIRTGWRTSEEAGSTK